MSIRKTAADIIWAKTGKQAIEMVQENHIDLILMDIKMPEMDGYEATKLIKKLNQNVPVISQSAYAMPGDIDKGLDSGMNDYLIKPVKPKTLLSVLNKHLNRLSPTG